LTVLYNSAIEGVLDELDDPNTSFIGAREWEDFRIRATDGDYAGVGLEVLPREGFVTVMTAIPGGPGARVGIRAGDRFLEIDGRPAEGMDVDEAVDLLRGEAGTSVEVVMGRPGVDEPIPFTLGREVIQLKSVPFGVVLDDGVGYIPLKVFRSTSAEEVQDEIDRLRTLGAHAFILDVRGNPGGILDEGIDITELFLEPGKTIVETRGRGAGQSEVYRARAPEAFPGLPLAILVDETSASAAEIVAGALQDHDRALVVGAPTFGKGSVQTLFRLTGGNVLRLTTAHWYTPVGRSIQKDLPEDRSELPRGAWTLGNSLVATEDIPDRPVFQSMGGRDLLGGGGITPDIWVIQDTLTEAEARAAQQLFAQAGAFYRASFNFAVRYLQERPGLDPDFRVTDGMVASFVRTLRDAGAEVADATVVSADRYIRFQLESEIALQAFGEEGQFLRLRDRDRQLVRALEAIRESSSASGLVAMGGDHPGAFPVGG
ncbi:MAG TPA: S41 family peptidase, partial [Longimicrobiales bacterium]|nr:S41 family peptidase [Longimicrobiales bacterium]